MEETARQDQDVQRIKLRIEYLDPNDVLTLDEAGLPNARFMTQEQYARLSDNIARDGGPTSAAFAVWNKEHNKYMVVSGNHRTKACRDVNTGPIPFIVTDDELTPDHLRAIQLSHNAIAGQDDDQILKKIYEAIENIDDRIYSGLDDATLKTLASVSMDSIREANMEWQPITFAFLPHEIEPLRCSIKEAQDLFGSNPVYAAHFNHYDALQEALEEVKGAFDIINAAGAFFMFLSIYDRHKTDLAEGWYDDETGNAKHDNYVPLSSIIGTASVPAEVAAVIKQAVDLMKKRGDVKERNAWQALELLAADYLAAGRDVT